MSSDSGEFLDDHKALVHMAKDAIASGRLPAGPADRISDCVGGGMSCTVCLLPISPQDPGFSLEFVKSGGVSANHFLHIPCFAVWKSQFRGSESTYTSGPHDERSQGNGHFNGQNPGPRR